jgi:hypothetical protein
VGTREIEIGENNRRQSNKALKRDAAEAAPLIGKVSQILSTRLYPAGWLSAPGKGRFSSLGSYPGGRWVVYLAEDAGPEVLKWELNQIALGTIWDKI